MLNASLRILALGLGAAALATLLASGPGARLGLWDWRLGLGLLRYAAYLGIAAAAVSLAGLLIPRTRGKALVLALILGLASLAPPLAFQRQALSVPPINDISTDSESKAQQEAYPDIKPIVLADPKEKAFERALAAAPAGGSRIDVRSKSRVGRGDAGTNARRIRGFRERLS